MSFCWKADALVIGNFFFWELTPVLQPSTSLSVKACECAFGNPCKPCCALSVKAFVFVSYEWPVPATPRIERESLRPSIRLLLRFIIRRMHRFLSVSIHLRHYLYSTLFFPSHLNHLKEWGGRQCGNGFDCSFNHSGVLFPYLFLVEVLISFIGGYSRKTFWSNFFRINFSSQTIPISGERHLHISTENFWSPEQNNCLRISIF